MWKCVKCTFDNKHWRKKCVLCKTPKAVIEKEYFGAIEGNDNIMSSIPKREWSCPQCTYDNKHYEVRCRMCKLTKDKVPDKLELYTRYEDAPFENELYTKGESGDNIFPDEDHLNTISSGDWSCAICTFINNSYHKKCRMCAQENHNLSNFNVGQEFEAPSQVNISCEFEVTNETRIVLIGRTGSGKSATGNSILGHQKFESKVSGSSITSKCEMGETWRDGKKVIVVDTPGLFDTGMTNENVTKEIVKCIGMTSPGPHAMILIVGIGRFTKEEQDTVTHFVNHFGEGMLRYMIVLFTRKDALFKSEQTIQEYVETVPNELKSILRECGNRYVAFNNDATEQDMEEQVGELFEMIDKMVAENGGACYTNEAFKAAEATLQRRIREQKRLLNLEKEREKEEIARQVRNKYQRQLEQQVRQQSRVEYQLQCKQNDQRRTRKQKQALQNEIKNLKRQLKSKDEVRPSCNYPSPISLWQPQQTRQTESRTDNRQLESKIESLQDQLHSFEIKNNDNDETEKLQREKDEADRLYQRKLEEQEREIRELSRQKDEEYRRRMDVETLRQNERANVEKESGGVISEIVGGLKRIGSGIVNAGKKVFNFIFG